jgi:coenzyme F420-reducing hydrogenase alpha subunit
MMTQVTQASRQIHINVPLLTRVEGEGALDLTIMDNQISELKFRIFEPPRFFEKFVEGRDYQEVPDLVARICGLCPVAYQMSSVHAIESIFALEITPWIRTMRRLFYCGEWIESHCAHIHLLAAPDFLGYTNAPAMAKDYPVLVQRGVYLQQLGNKIIKLLGGRSVHPVGVRVGGFHRSPSVKEARELLAELEVALPLAEKLVTWATTLKVPEISQKFISVSTQHPSEYPMNEGRIVSNDGLDIAIADYEQHFREFQIPHSTSLCSLMDEKPYLVGPLARVNLNWHLLPDVVRNTVNSTGIGISFPSQNMFDSIVVRAVEVYYAFYEAIRILKEYQATAAPFVPVEIKAGVGYGCTEAPRGLLWQRWEIDDTGHVVSAKIVPPTSQNQARIEQDLRETLEAMGLDKETDALRLRAETVIRNYDPCISCATHFLKFNVTRL